MKVKAKVTKIMTWPTRTINLGSYSSVKLSAGLEIQFDQPVSIDGKEVKEAFKEAYKITTEQFKEQYKPYKDYLRKRKEVNTNG